MPVLVSGISRSRRDCLFWGFATLVQHPYRSVGVSALCYFNGYSVVQTGFLPAWFRPQQGMPLDDSSTMDGTLSPQKGKKPIQPQAQHCPSRTNAGFTRSPPPHTPRVPSVSAVGSQAGSTIAVTGRSSSRVTYTMLEVHTHQRPSSYLSI